MAADPPLKLPVVKISPRGVSRLKSGHVWVYRSDLEEPEAPSGALVSVVDSRGKVLGAALYSSTSQIAIRMISSGPVRDFPALIRERIGQAIDYRARIVRDTDAFRVIFSEADFLPGLIVDHYADILSLQILTQAMDADAVREVILEELNAHLNPAAIVERVEARVRELEKLPPRDSRLLTGEKTSTVVTMNHVKFEYDALAGQKTGAFLDQRENYAAAAQYAHGEALDVFCYQGGFALHLAPRCSRVTGVDSSRPALEAAENNAQLNGCEVEWLEGNAFDVLKDWSGAGKQFDTIILDPPAFAKTKRDVAAALRGYKELNLRALKMLRPGGILVTCSCSYHVSESALRKVLGEAAVDAHRTVRLLEARGQSQDHPILLNVPETSYLKCLITHVSN